MQISCPEPFFKCSEQLTVNQSSLVEQNKVAWFSVASGRCLIFIPLLRKRLSGEAVTAAVTAALVGRPFEQKHVWFC